MTSSLSPSRRPRLLLAAPLALALSLSWGCSHSAPAREPAAPALDNPSAAAAAAQRPDELMSPVAAPTPAPDPAPVAAAEPAPARAAAPRRENRAARRDANLASPEIVGAGTVDRGDLSEALVPASPPRPAVLEQREIDGQFEQSEGRLQACFRSNRAPTGSEVIVGFVIGPDGHVTSVWPVASKVNVGVTQCILKTVNGFQFRATSNGTTRATSTIRYE